MQEKQEAKERMKKVIAGFVLLLMVGVSWSAEEIVVKTAYEDV